ncbi:MAG: ABC transporter permease [Clostridiales bacterium]|nr:ABC transporter permease [Clostridiales bacterium]
MNLRAFKAIFLKAFGRNGNGGAKASATTFVICVVFIFAVLCSIVNLMLSGWLNVFNAEKQKNILLVNAPDSFDTYLYQVHYDVGKKVSHISAYSAYDASEYNKLMKIHEAYMTIYFPTDFEKTIEKGKKAEILTYVRNDKLVYSEWHTNIVNNVLDGYQNHLKSLYGVPVTSDPPFEVEIESFNYEGSSGVQFITNYFAKVIVPLITFIAMLYIGMSKGTNAVSGQKEKGTFTGVLLTPVRIRTVISGNLCGIWLATAIPALVCFPLICLMYMSVKALLIGIVLILTLSLLISTLTLMISIMNDTVVSAQTAFLPVFFILLAVCITCMQGVNNVSRFYYWFPVYGHFYGLGRCLAEGYDNAIDLILCVLSTLFFAMLFTLISGVLLKTERFTTTVESYSDKRASKYLRALRREELNRSKPLKAIIYDYVPKKYVKTGKLLFHHIRYPLIVLSVYQTIAMIPAIVALSKTTFFQDMLDTLKRLSDIRDSLSASFEIFSKLMTQPVYILCMGFGYLALIATYFIKVRFLEKQPLRTCGIYPSVKKGIIDYLLGMVLGIAMMGSVFLLLIITKRAEVTSIGLGSGNIKLFVFYILMWIPQGFSEELMFRGYMMPRLSPRFGKAFAVFFSSFLFALFHAMNKGFTFLALINLILIAAAYALICLYTDSILMTSATHSVWNFAQGNLFGLEVSGNASAASIIYTSYLKGVPSYWSGGQFGPEGGLFVTLVSVITIGIVLLLLLLRKRKRQPAS